MYGLMSSTLCLDTCWLCDGPMNESKEHILPKAITYEGSLQVTGFICEDCNNRTGTEWDASLATTCQPKFRSDSNYPVHLRKSGPRRTPTDFITFDGEVIEGSTDFEGNFHERRRKPEETEEGDGYASVSLQGSMSDKKFLEQMENAKERFHGPTTEVLRTETVHGIPSYEISIQWDEISKTLIKSYMALAYRVGIDPNACDTSITYLRGETPTYTRQEPPIFLFREHDVRYRHVIVIYSMGRFLVGGAHISGLPLELYGGTNLDGGLHVESLVPALMSTRYDGPSVMKAYVVSVKDKQHRILDIRHLLGDGTMRFNPRQP